MANGTFNVSEFNTIYTMLDDKSNKITGKSNEIISICEQLSQLLKSTDSSLSSSYIRVSETLVTIRSKIVNLLTQLENEMRLYASRTMENEQAASEGLEKMNADIENISLMLDEIAKRNS